MSQRAQDKPTTRLAGEERAREAMQRARLTPSGPYAGKTNAPWAAVCDVCGAECAPWVSHLLRGSGGCRVCGAKASGLAQRLNQDEARAAMVREGLLPQTDYPGRVNTPWPCECMTCGTVFNARYNNVVKGHGCPECGRAKAADTQRMNPVVAADRARSAGFEPVDNYPGNVREPWRCRHSCGAVVRVALANMARAAEGKGCRACAEYGYRSGKPGWVYLVHGTVNGRETVKYGISNVPLTRLTTHRGAGLSSVLVVTGTLDGQLPLDLERACKALHRASVVPTSRQGGNEFGGFTESFDLDQPGAVTLLAGLRALISKTTAAWPDILPLPCGRAAS